MTDTATETAHETGGARTRSAGQVVRWLVTGIGTLIVLSVVGGLLVGLFAGQAFESAAAATQCAKAIRVYDLLLVTPLAIGVAAGLVVGVPTARVLRARRARTGQDGLTARRKVFVLSVAAKCGFISAALFWSVSGQLVPRTSFLAAHWANGDDTDRLHEDFYGFDLPSVENWSIAESIGLGLVLVVVACVAGLRYVPADDRPAARQVLIAAAVLTVLLGAFFALHAARSYDDVKETPVKAEQGRHHTVFARISRGDEHTDGRLALPAAVQLRDAVVPHPAGGRMDGLAA